MAALLAVAELVACGGASEPEAVTNPAAFLAVGVSLEETAAAVRRDFTSEGALLQAERRTSRFDAMLFSREGGARTVLRVVTRAGIALGMEAPSAAWAGLLTLPAFGTQGVPDLDGDGDGDLVVGTVDSALERVCLEAFRVDTEGALVPMSVQRVPPWTDACIEKLEAAPMRAVATLVLRDDVASDGATSARVDVPLVIVAGHFRRAAPEASAAHWGDVEARNAAALDVAKRNGATKAIVRVAYERAMARFALGDSAKAARKAFDDAVRGTNLGAADAAWAADLSAHIEREWPLVAQESGP